jgi:uncharacterized NAD-dependent epimerase/dehydratase family protein
MGLRPKFTNADIDTYVMEQYQEAEKKLIEVMQFVGEGFIKEARSMTKQMGGFGDITGNLRSSIGYVIVKDGNVIKETVYVSDKGTDRRTGVKTGERFMEEISKGEGLRLYGVAGMEYAAEVESRGYNVISVQADMALVELKEILSELK